MLRYKAKGYIVVETLYEYLSIELKRMIVWGEHALGVAEGASNESYESLR